MQTRRRGGCAWTVRPAGPHTTIVGVRIIGTTKGIVGTLASIPFAWMLAKGAAGLPNDLKTHVEKPPS